MKQIKSQTTSFAMSGQYDKAIETFKKAMNQVYFTESSYSFNDFKNFFGTVSFICKSVPFVKAIINKRMMQIRSYEYTLEGNEVLKKIIHKNEKLIYNILLELVLQGKCLCHISQFGVDWEINIIEPHRYYYDGEVGIVFIDDTDNDLINRDDYIYFGESLIDISAIGGQLVVSALTMEHNRSLWYNNNLRLNGFIHSSISPEVDDGVKAVKEDANIGDKIVEEVSQLANFGGVLNTPSGVSIEHKSVVNTAVGGSYKQFIDEIKDDIEIMLLGNAGITRQQGVGSYAKSKVMENSTIDILHGDIITLESIVSDLIDHFVYRLDLTEPPTTFKINVSADSGMKDTVAMLSQLSSIGIRGTDGKPLQISKDWLSNQTNIEFINTDMLVLGASNNTEDIA